MIKNHPITSWPFDEDQAWRIILPFLLDRGRAGFPVCASSESLQLTIILTSEWQTSGGIPCMLGTPSLPSEICSNFRSDHQCTRGLMSSHCCSQWIFLEVSFLKAIWIKEKKSYTVVFICSSVKVNLFFFLTSTSSFSVLLWVAKFSPRWAWNLNVLLLIMEKSR